MAPLAGFGGSSGVLPPGDVRKALLALADPASKMASLLAYRFVKGELAGHPVGNLVLAALTDLKGGFIEAVDAMSRLLGLQGRVLPSTLMPAEVVHAELVGVDRPERHDPTLLATALRSLIV